MINNRQAPRSRLRIIDLGAIAVVGLRARPMRTALSATGIALGLATMIAVIGISASSRSQLIAQIDRLGTNLLTVSPSQGTPDRAATLPGMAPAMIDRIGSVQSAAAIGDVNASIYRSDRIPAANTAALTVFAADPGLLMTVQGTLAHGRFLNPATAQFPAVVLGADTAAALGVDETDTPQVWLGGHWFTVIGILNPIPLAPELDRTALIGFPVARTLLAATSNPAEIYLRVNPTEVGNVKAVLAATANPAAPQNISIANPADALLARASANNAFHGLLLALGAVAVIVGAVGIANVMIIAVIERRGEIGLRRALGGTAGHIATQFIAESALLAALGGAAGATLGAAATTIYATSRRWNTTISPLVLGSGIAAALVIGVIAGLYPALRAARLPPSEAIRSL
jgi:putative ABC transport system permease protein